MELEDDGKYQCQVSPTDDGQPGLRSRFARLSVLVPPQKPKILQGDFLVTTEDRELTMECISVGGKPAADVSILHTIICTLIFYLSSICMYILCKCNQVNLLVKFISFKLYSLIL